MKIKFTDRIKYHQISAKMLSICHDMIRKIGELLSDKEKMALTMTSIDMDQLKYVFIYYEKINICKIDKLPFSSPHDKYSTIRYAFDVCR